MIRPPSLPAAASALGATAFLLLYRGAPTAFDEWLALPIALETARPGTYPLSDVLVQESLSGPFHLYKAASLIWSLGWNVDVVWYVLLAMSLVVFFLAVWRLGEAMGLDVGERAVLVCAIAVTPVYRGTLHWSAQPNLSFITASVAVPIALWALTGALEGRLRRALVLSAVTFALHPSLGLCAGVTTLSIVPGSFSPQAMRLAWLPAFVVAAPNVVYLAMHLPAPTAGDGAALWDVHRVFGYHTFVRDHADGYPWYALTLAVALVGLSHGEVARRVRRAVLVLSVLAIGWIALMNLAPVPALLPLYLVRATWLVKPLVMGLAVVVVVRGQYSGRYGRWAPLVGAVAVAHPDRMVAEGALAILLGIILRPSTNRARATLGLAAWTAGIVLLLTILAREAQALDPLTEAAIPMRWVAMTVGLLAVLVALAPTPSPLATPRIPPAPRTLGLAAVGLVGLAIVLGKPFGRGWLPDTLSRISTQLHLTRPLPAEAGVMRWAREQSPKASLFAVPPVDQRWVRFRLAAERGVYASVHDINQLMYVRHDVLTAVARLRVLGVRVRGPHRFDPRPYLRPTCQRLDRMARDGVDYYILPTEGTIPAGSVLPYQDGEYAVLDVRATARTCGSGVG
ncbi:MAG: hypothetical protein FJ363_03825 [Gemmatimonadetes bacterium]|nr:hypothetical protein [Gemmatimonadota bacterium]